MKYYGIEICKFCGIPVSTSTPSILPEFVVHMTESIKTFLVNVDTFDCEEFTCVFNKTNENSFKAIMEVVDTEDFVVNITGNRNYSPLVKMDDFDIN